MKKTLLIVLVLGAAAFGTWFFVLREAENGTETEQTGGGFGTPGDSIDPKEAEEIRVRRQKLREMARPDTYLELEYDYKKKFLGPTVVEGKLRNVAEYATFTDIELKIRFSAGEAVLDSLGKVLYEEMRPGDTLNFRVDVKAPKKTDHVYVRVRDAKAD